MFRICFVFLILFSSCKEKIKYYKLPSINYTGNINAVVEIPAGTNKKIEFNTKTKKFEIDQIDGHDRIVQFIPYPGNYGFIPSTSSSKENGGDGDALDVLVLSESVKTGTVLEIKPIAILKLIDNGEIDDKIIAVPVNEENQIVKINSYKELLEKNPKIKNIIELWFLNYNKKESAIVDRWGDEKEALIQIQNSQKK